MNIKVAGPTLVSSKAKDAVAFYATHFDVIADDYGAGDACWYWTLTFGEHSELSFQTPQGGEPEFDCPGMFFYLEFDDVAAVEAQRARMVAAGVEATEPVTVDAMHHFWVTDPAGLRLYVFSAA